ncbi:hypothetical protein QQF64_020307, partial [Cirrhinus molitorella]
MPSSSGEELQCSICLNVFTDPVTTPCGHNFCRTCLNKCWTNKKTCYCPFCKEKFRKRPDLKINTTLRELVQHFKKQLKRGRSEVFCDFCDERKQEAVKSCLTCPSSYCETHLEPHLRVPRLKKHKLINAVENLEDYICQKHERPLELFCRDDQMCVCLSCTEGDHRTHNIVSIEEESQQKKNQLVQTETDVQQMIQDRMKKIQEIQHSVEMRKICRVLHCITEVIADHAPLSAKVFQFSGWFKSPESSFFPAACKACSISCSASAQIGSFSRKEEGQACQGRPHQTVPALASGNRSLFMNVPKQIPVVIHLLKNHFSSSQQHKCQFHSLYGMANCFLLWAHYNLPGRLN